MKPLYRETTLVMTGEDMRNILTEAICDGFGAFKALRVWKVVQAEGDRFVVELEPLPKPVAQAPPPTKQATEIRAKAEPDKAA